MEDFNSVDSSEQEFVSDKKGLKGRFSLSKLPSTIIVLLAFLLPVVFLPISVSTFSVTKGFTLLALILIASFVWVLFKLKDTPKSLPFNLLTVSVIAVPVIYLVSAFFSGNVGVSLYGRGFGFDSVISLSFLFLLMILVTALFQDVKKVFRLYSVMFIAFVLVAVFHVIRLIFIEGFPTFGFFRGQTSNTIGKWNDIAVYSGFFTILTMITLQVLPVEKKIRRFLIAGLALSVFLLALVNFTLIWYVVGIFALLFFVYFLSVNKANGDEDDDIPLTSLVVLLISFLFILSGNSLGGFLSDSLNISFSEARPSWTATGEVIKGSLTENPIFGYGPNRFENAWIELKPSEVNLSDFWNVDFRYGVGLLPTYVVTTGILGMLSWIFFLGMFSYFGFKAMFTRIENKVSKYVMLSSFIGALYLWVNTFLFIPSIVTYTLTFMVTGIFFGSLYREGMLKVKTVDMNKDPKFGFFYIFIMVIFLIAIVASGFVVTKKFIAGVHFQGALVELNINGDVPAAEVKIGKVLSLHQNDISYRLLSEISRIRINQIANDQESSQEVLQAQFRAALSNAVAGSQAAIDFDDTNYGNTFELGRVYESVTPFKIEGAVDQARTAYKKARELNPKSPFIPLSMARLEANNENNDGARELLADALELKPNYIDAIYLLSQIDVSEGDITTAISNVEAATFIQPNDPNVFFQLGLLLYNDESYERAYGAFEQAVILNPVFSNAKYFLGLSYQEVERYDDAIGQFKDLLILNPGNEEVKFILDNLEVGNSPFNGVQPPLDAEPESREEPPLDEDEEGGELEVIEDEEN